MKILWRKANYPNTLLQHGGTVKAAEEGASALVAALFLLLTY